MRPTFTGGLAAALLCLPLAAQETTTETILRFVPADAGLVVQLDGPGKLRETFGETNVARMLTSEAYADAIDTLLSEGDFEGSMDEMLDETGIDMRMLLDSLRGYRGRMALGLQLRALSEEMMETLSESAAGFSSGPSEEALGGALLSGMLLTLSLTPDGETDFAATADQVLEAVREQDMEEGVRLVDIDLGDGGATVVEVDLDEDNRLQVLLPTLVDGHLLMALGTDLETRLLDVMEGEGYVAEPDAAASGVAIDARPTLIQPLLQLAGAGVAGAMQMMMPLALGPGEMVDMLEQNLRLEGLQGLNVRVRPLGERVAVETAVASDPQLPSLVRDLARPGLERFSLLSLIPREHTAFASTGVDLGVVMEMLGGMAEDLGQGDTAMMEDNFREATGYDLRADLLDRLDGQVVFFDDAAMGEGGETSFGAPAMSLMIGTNDSKGMADMIAGILRDNGLQGMMKKGAYRDVEVTTVNAGMVALDYAFVDGAMLVGVGREGTENLRAIIDRKLAGDAADGDWPEAVQSRIEQLTPGWRDLSVSGSSMALDPDSVMQIMEVEQWDLSEDAEAAVGEILRLIRDFELDTSITATRFESGRVVQQTIY